MCKLLLISEKTHNPDFNAIGDIVTVQDDDHVFSGQEADLFTLVSVPNITAAEFLAALKSPKIQTVKESSGVEHTMWRNSESDPWQKLVKRVKHQWTTTGLTAEEKSIFLSADVDKATKIAMLEQFGNNTSFQPENRATIVNITVTEAPA